MPVDGYELDRDEAPDGSCCLTPFDLAGCVALGDTYTEARAIIGRAVREHLGRLRAAGYAYPPPQTVSAYRDPERDAEYRRGYPPLVLPELLRMIELAGWTRVSDEQDPCRHYLHPTRTTVITIAGDLSGEVPLLAEREVLRVAGALRQPRRRHHWWPW